MVSVLLWIYAFAMSTVARLPLRSTLVSSIFNMAPTRIELIINISELLLISQCYHFDRPSYNYVRSSGMQTCYATSSTICCVCLFFLLTDGRTSCVCFHAMDQHTPASTTICRTFASKYCGLAVNCLPLQNRCCPGLLVRSFWVL